MPISTQIKKDFPVFQHHPDLIYLDSTASALKPQAVIDAERRYYETCGVNVHRGIYGLSMEATTLYEQAREQLRAFINAQSTKEIIFVRGATEGINLVAQSFGQQLHKGDVIVLSDMEHHANIVPWQKLRDDRGILLRWIPVTESGELDLTNIDDILKDAKLVAVTQMSNVLGTVNDVKMLAQKAHAVGAKILVDGAQSVPHMPVDVQNLDCDFLVFSGHKMVGPTGIGVLYAKEAVLETMEPYQRGGDMILEVTKEAATWNELPYKFEAGTPNIAGAIGLGAAAEYLSSVGMDQVWQHDQELAAYGMAKLAIVPGVKVLGTSTVRGAIFALDIAGVHPHDIGSILDEQHIAVRAGHHCAQPLHQRFGLVATARASCYLYTTKADIDRLIIGIQKVQEVFA
jgi:cysteine desulfurase/selenocysteine lyase